MFKIMNVNKSISAEVLQNDKTQTIEEDFFLGNNIYLQTLIDKRCND